MVSRPYDMNSAVGQLLRRMPQQLPHGSCSPPGGGARQGSTKGGNLSAELHRKIVRHTVTLTY